MGLLFNDSYNAPHNEPIWIVRLPEVLSKYLPIGEREVRALIESGHLEAIKLARCGTGWKIGITKRSILKYQKEHWGLEPKTPPSYWGINKVKPEPEAEPEPLASTTRTDSKVRAERRRRHRANVVRAAYDHGLAKPLSFKGRRAELSANEQAKLRYKHEVAIYETIKELRPDLILTEEGED